MEGRINQIRNCNWFWKGVQNNCTVLWYDCNKSNWLHVLYWIALHYNTGRLKENHSIKRPCALYFWWHMTQHMKCPIALYRNTAGNGHQMSFERLKDYLSGVTFEVSLAKGHIHPETTADHSTHHKRGKKRATYIPCKLQLVGWVHWSREQMT